ncbi:MAG: hypothetical protein ACRC7O_12295 [Fimbriiglobus sp.]
MSSKTLVTQWSWLSSHPQRAAVTKYVTGKGVLPATLKKDVSVSLIKRDRRIHEIRAEGFSLRHIAEVEAVSRQTVWMCLRVYAGEATLPTGTGREKIAGDTSEKITAAVIKKYNSGAMTMVDVMSLVGTSNRANATYWLKKKAAQFGITLLGKR